MIPGARPSRDDILDAFAVEQDAGRATLERYLKQFPEYASDLLDLSRELREVTAESEGRASPNDATLISAAWERHFADRIEHTADPLAAVSAARWREVAKRLDVPRQIITAFRERRVTAGSVPRRFLAQFAAALNSSIEELANALALPPSPAVARSYKADTKPSSVEQVPFEQLLIEAGVPAERRAILLADEG